VLLRDVKLPQRFKESIEAKLTAEQRVAQKQFELLDHPMAPRCYCWELDGEVTAVLREKPVGSAQEAVRAAVMEEGPSGNDNP
jgi:hypothetical protein